MIELVRSNDPVVLSFAAALLKDTGIDTVLLDQHMSVLEGSIGVLARRLMVARDDEDRARWLLTDAGVSVVARDV